MIKEIGMEFFYLLLLTLTWHHMIAPANSVLVEANAEAVGNDTCWTKIRIPCETSSTTRQAGLLKDLSSEKSIGLTVYKNHDVMDCYPWMFRNPRNGNCECSNIPQTLYYVI